ncbi:MAG: hypothetical protein IJ193_00515 [Bacilli bacterium]|nr:hypothetical protein [Bacilli bacterium]
MNVPTDYLTNYQNYFVFESLVRNGTMSIKTSDINLSNYQDYYYGIKNILKDGIELQRVQQMKITVDFGNGDIVNLSIFDLYYNIIMWYIVIRTGLVIDGGALFYPKHMTQKAIKKYLDKYVILNRKKFSPKEINNILDDTLYRFSDVDEFSFYLANTINLKDNIELMNAIPEFNDLLHTSLENVRIENVKDEGMKRAYRSIEIIKNDSERVLGYDHCLKNSFEAEEGTNERQYKEFAIHIGSKPNGNGGVHPHIIDKSYLTAGLEHVADQFVDSASSRVAQIQMKKNTGTSGNFARILGDNNMDSIINPDPNFKCDTKNFEVYTVEDEKFLDMIVGRYYKLDPDGADFLVGPKDYFLIGTTIYMYSPMTCASAAHGNGICYRCYGDLAYVNNNIKVGKFASDELSSQLTQRQLSAKHLLETVVKKIIWSKEFDLIFDINVNKIFIKPESTGYLFINPEEIYYENEDEYVNNMDDDDMANTRYITELEYIDSLGVQHVIGSEDGTNMYLTKEFEKYLQTGAEMTDDGMYKIDISYLASSEYTEFDLFSIHISNNDIGKNLKDIENLINRKNTTTSFNKDQLLQQLVRLIINGKLNIKAVHLEVLLSNQIRSSRDILKKPDWSDEDPEYTILTLDQALKDNPSVINSLIYQNLGYVLSYPLTYKKSQPSKMDLFFMLRPQDYIANYVPEDHPKTYKVTPAYLTYEGMRKLDELEKEMSGKNDDSSIPNN